MEDLDLPKSMKIFIKTKPYALIIKYYNLKVRAKYFE